MYEKLDLKVVYLIPYERTVWLFSRANSDHIKRPINLLVWESLLDNIDVSEQISAFNGTVRNIMSNSVHKELVPCDNRDSLWMNCYVKISL